MSGLIFICQNPLLPPSLPPSLPCRVVSSYFSAGEAVHYALHHILSLVTIDNVAYERPLNGIVADSNQRVRPVLRLPDVFDLYHLSNQATSLLASHAIVGRAEGDLLSVSSASPLPPSPAYSLLSVARDTKSKSINQEKVDLAPLYLQSPLDCVCRWWSLQVSWLR